MNKIYVICTIFYDPFGRIMGFGFYNQQYEHKKSAVRRAKQLYGDNPRVEWFIVEESPEYAIFMPMIYY
jgi:hypothetical protein